MIDQSYFELIHSAMTARRVIQFKLNQTWHTVEPYMTGRQSGTLHPCLYGFCRDQLGANRWQLFSLQKIESLELTYYGFDPHPDYKEQGPLFEQVYKRIPFSQVVVDYKEHRLYPFNKPVMRVVASASRLRLRS